MKGLEWMDIKRDVQDQFGRSADLYISSKIHRHGGDLETLIGMSHAGGTERALDVATGGGHTANRLAPLVRNVTAMDITPKMLEKAEEFIRGNGHDNVAFVEGDAEKMPFDDGSFDLVTCRIAPHHFPDIEAFVSEVYRVLAPGGRFLLDDNVAPEEDIFGDFYNRIEKMRDYSHYRAWKKTEWLGMLERAGFEIIEMHRFEKHFDFEDWCTRMHLSDDEKEDLNKIMLGADERVQKKFRIRSDDGKVGTFQGEAVLLSCVKWE